MLHGGNFRAGRRVFQATRFAESRNGCSVPVGVNAVAQTRPATTTARTRSVGTKLTEEEFARLESLAAASGQSVSEWAREERSGRVHMGARVVTTSNPKEKPGSGTAGTTTTR